MTTQTLFLNVYRAGVYHRQGKPDTTNLHGGDLYTTYLAATAAAEEGKGYLFTVPIEVPVPHGTAVYVNGPESVPTPLSVTQRREDSLLPWYTRARSVPPILTAGQCVIDGTCPAPSLDSKDDPFAGPSYAEWRANRVASGFAPLAKAHKPAHGGYPDDYDAAKHAAAYPGY